MKILYAAQQFDFHPQEINRNIHPLDFGQAHGVLFGGDDGAGAMVAGLVDQVNNFLLGVAVMVGETLAIFEPAALPPDFVFKTFGDGDARDGRQPAPRQPCQRLAFAGVNVLQVKRLVRADGNFRARVELAQPGFQLRLLGVRRLGDENEIRPPDNDAYGHPGGDQALKEFVLCVKGAFRQDMDWVARYGGEEFVIVLPETNIEGACALAERIRMAIANRVIPYGGREIRITSSFGITGFDAGASAEKISEEDIIRKADQCPYRAKEGGRNRVVAEGIIR